MLQFSPNKALWRQIVSRGPFVLQTLPKGAFGDTGASDARVERHAVPYSIRSTPRTSRSKSSE